MNDNPILNNPYAPPQLHYATNPIDGSLNYNDIRTGRRIFSREKQVFPGKQAQPSLLDFNESASNEDLNHIVNLLRKEVNDWRNNGYKDVTRVTQTLLNFWFNNPEREVTKQLFFAQQEAVETAIWLNEVAEKTNPGNNILSQLKDAWSVIPDPEKILQRIGFKMATGAGKTVVMAALILYHYFNRCEYRNDTRFADYFLIVAPGVTIKDRLSVLYVDTLTTRKDEIKDYYRVRGLVPQKMEDLLEGLNSKLVITNYHSFELKTLQGNKKSPFDGKVIGKDVKGKDIKNVVTENPVLMIKRLVSSFKTGGRLLVINDEAHHCYFPKTIDKKNNEKYKTEAADLTQDEKEDVKEENERAAVWYNGLVKTGGFTPNFIASIGDYIIWYSRNKILTKFRPLFIEEPQPPIGDTNYVWLELDNGEVRKMTPAERRREIPFPKNARIFRYGPLTSDGKSNTDQKFLFKGIDYYPPGTSHWKTKVENLNILANKGYILNSGKGLAFKTFWDFFPASRIDNIWLDTQSGGFNEAKKYVVQTTQKVIQRCLLMTTDPGDLVLDPTCGSGTTAYVAEQWGRRWITTDTSRIALNLAKTRLMTAVFPYYYLYDEVYRGLVVNGFRSHSPLPGRGVGGEVADIRNGFIYETVPHITLKSLANDEPAETETLYDKPKIDNKRIRVSGPFTVETLQNFEPIAPEELEKRNTEATDVSNFEQKIFQHLKSAGVKNGLKNETAVFTRVEHLASPFLHAEGFYQTPKGEKKAYFHIGPQFGTVSRQAVNEAVKECRNRGGADWLIILGFSFESDISNSTETTSLGTFEVSKVRMADDLLQEGLLKKDKKAASFMTIGEPDVRLLRSSSFGGGREEVVTVEIAGMDIYDPIKDEVKSFNREDIAYWMVDDDYDGANFIVKQVFFCGGDDEFDKWRNALQKTVKVEIDEEAWSRLYKHISHPIRYKKGKKIAVRVISQFGEESTKVLTL